jgi:hypothetical protein
VNNLVSNTGVVATDTTSATTARYGLAAAGYGGNKAIFGYGNSGSSTAITNLVGSTGSITSEIGGVGTARFGLAAAGYGGDKAIFGYGLLTQGTGNYTNVTNLVTGQGSVATDSTGVGTSRYYLAGCSYSS